MLKKNVIVIRKLEIRSYYIVSLVFSLKYKKHLKGLKFYKKTKNSDIIKVIEWKGKFVWKKKVKNLGNQKYLGV